MREELGECLMLNLAVSRTGFARGQPRASLHMAKWTVTEVEHVGEDSFVRGAVAALSFQR